MVETDMLETAVEKLAFRFNQVHVCGWGRGGAFFFFSVTSFPGPTFKFW
jgi:hypothetical protein